MGSLAPWHLILLVLVLLLVFGSKRLIGMGKGLGSSLRGFRDGLVHDDEPPADPPAREAVVEARQATPAPTPEVARAEVAEAEEGRPPAGSSGP